MSEMETVTLQSQHWAAIIHALNERQNDLDGDTAQLFMIVSAKIESQATISPVDKAEIRAQLSTGET